jgi:hypothetical protein
MRKLGFFLAVFCLVGISSRSHAYPEMVRHGYVNCTSCHISPNGGGILNGYGRVQSEEVLSTWAREGEGGVLHGLVPPLDPVSLGGQFRALQLFRNDSESRFARYIVMQADLEAAFKWRNFEAVATAGFQEGAQPFISRRHYLIFRPNEESPWMLRVGRFQPAFGINVADHAIATKVGIGLGQGTESYNIEGAWLGESFDLFATAVFGRPGEDRDRGVVLRGALNLGDRSKVGFGYYLGARTTSTRQLFGPYAVLGFTEHFFLLAELDFQALSAAGTTKFGPASYVRLDYEFIRGLHGYLTGEFSKTDPTKASAGAFGLGAQFFPRPHFEFRVEYTKRQDAMTSDRLADYIWLMGHYYL